MLKCQQQLAFEHSWARKIAFSDYLNLEKAEFLDIFYTYEHVKFHAQLSYNFGAWIGKGEISVT